jgi:hypothetical protein
VKGQSRAISPRVRAVVFLVGSYCSGLSDRTVVVAPMPLFSFTLHACGIREASLCPPPRTARPLFPAARPAPSG